MENPNQTSFTFEIDNFLEKKSVIPSPKFISGGCEWFVIVYPKGKDVEDHLSMFLCVADHGSLRVGWKRRASFSFALLNQSDKEIYRICGSGKLFCDQFTAWGLAKAVPLAKLQEEGFLEKNKLRVKVEVKVVEVVDQGDATGNKTFDFHGFHVHGSEVVALSWLFIEHPDFAANFRPLNESVKTTCMNLLLGLIETLNRPPQSLSKSDIRNSRRNLIKLTEEGFKLDWLKTKLYVVYLEWKKTNSDGSRVQELEEQVKNLKLELQNEKVKSAAKVLLLKQTVFLLEQTVSNLRDEISKQWVEW
ncbi:unnamed protein product [Microthlaspi erraticum]|uniref:MATH domain-containing protein n=1 Tax=Microthlaspi erraticum TaxID=1685480 RepID=A0A6D2K5G8_9BRAS|nr:unnamed protein product [Microthlaspi erraticum]